MDIELWTDGAYSFTEKQMGLGVVILEDGNITTKFSHGYKGGTNQKAEVAAFIIGLRFLTKPFDKLTIYTDSMYVIGQITKGWKRNKNVSLLKEADKQLKRVSKLCNSVEFVHVKGHADSEINNLCDQLAVHASKAIIT